MHTFDTSRSVAPGTGIQSAQYGHRDTGYALDMDLDAWREAQGYSYDRLAEVIGAIDGAHARKLAIGERWPRDATMLDRIVAATGGAVTILAMHNRRAEWQRQNRRPSRIPSSEVAV